ncbi:MAG: HEAT repeat domain-containing protein [Deltaproteobacteria bacterium]|nr:HEAT repeat domain-containing protein [Deltaproteobacteria bacterium]
MGKNLGAAVIELCDHERADLRAAAITVLAAVGKGDDAVTRALSERLEDPDPGVRRIALEGLVEVGATGIAAKLVPLLRGDDESTAERAAELLLAQGAGAEAALRKELGHGEVRARRVIAQLLLKRGTAAAIDAILDQLADHEFGEQALQLVRGALDQGADKLAAIVEKSASARAAEAGKRTQKEWARAVKEAAKADDGAGAKGKKAKGAKADAKDDKKPAVPRDPLRDPEVARAVAELGALLRLLGYLADPGTQALLLRHTSDEHPRPIRLAAIAALRRIVASAEAKHTEATIAALIEYADGDDLAVAQSAIDTLRGARVPDKLAKAFAGLAKSKNPAAQKLAMERLPAGGGASAIKPLIDALAGDDPTARDAAARGLAKAPEAALPLARGLVAATDEQIARRFAGALHAHRGQLPKAAIEELVGAAREHLDEHTRGKASADGILLERVLMETLADVAPAEHVALLFDRARRLRQKGKSAEAFGTLKPLLRTRAELDAAIADDDRFLLAVLGLEVAGDAIVRAAHADDPVIDQFARLSAKGYAVAKKLNKEKEISDEAIYGLGFRLIEATDSKHKDLGAELLEGIIEERPRSKLAKSARNKLKLTGYLDE